MGLTAAVERWKVAAPLPLQQGEVTSDTCSWRDLDRKTSEQCLKTSECKTIKEQGATPDEAVQRRDDPTLKVAAVEVGTLILDCPSWTMQNRCLMPSRWSQRYLTCWK